MRRRLYCHSMKYIPIFELCSQAPEIHCALKIQDGAAHWLFWSILYNWNSLYIGVHCTSFWLTSVDTYFSFSCKLLTDKNSLLRSHEHWKTFEDLEFYVFPGYGKHQRWYQRREWKTLRYWWKNINIWMICSCEFFFYKMTSRQHVPKS